MKITNGISMVDLKPTNLSIFDYSEIDNINDIKKDDIITLKDEKLEFKIKVTNVKEGKTSIDKIIDFEKIN